MSYSKKLPVYRYFQVRLRKLKQPTVLGSAIALLLLLIGVWQYWSHPEWLLGNKNNTNQLDSADSSTLSPGDIAALADIDNSSVLNQQLDLPLFSQPLAAPNQKSSTTKPDNLLETINPQQTVAQINPTSLPLSNIPSYQQNIYNPFADLTANTSSSNLVGLNNNSLSINPTPNQYSSPNSALTSNPSSNFNGFNPVNPTTNAAPVSALQAALSQLTPSPALVTPTAIPNQQQTAVNQPQNIPPSTINNYNLPPTSATAYPNSFPSNDYTYLNRPVIPPSIPNAVPGNPNNFNQPAVQNLNQLNGFNNPGYTSTPVNPGLPPSQLNQSNFSTPGINSGSENGQNQSIFSNP